jgi:multidrug resistance efflux pump
MTNRTPRIIIAILLIAAVATAVYWYFFMRPATQASGALTASGTVETTEISIAPELSGKILEVDVQEGDAVKAGDVFFKLDDTLLKTQRIAAAAGVDTAKGAASTADAAAATAQAQYDITYNAAQTQNKAPARTADWTKNALAQFTLPDWYFSQTEQLTAAQAEVDVAQKALTDAQAKLTAVQGQISSADFVKAEADLALAQARFAVADNLNTRVQNSKSIDDLTKRQLFLMSRNAMNLARGRDPNWAVPINIDQELRDAAKTLYDDAKTALDDAQSAYDDALTTKGANDVLKARADVSIAQELYYTAQDYTRILQTGVESSSVTAAQKVLEQAQSAAAQAKIAINQAQANLDLVDAQIAKTIITAPVDGVILTRAAEPGSVVNAGGVMLTLGRLDELTITVYVPEDRIGEVTLGQVAQVAVDSFPGVTFNATVTFIADQAEFTPRNVQTVEGRKNTVFAVKLKLDNTSGKLKPGMPADVTFDKK